MTQAALAVTWDRVLADAAFDAEEHHRYAREDLGVRSTVIPLNRRWQGRKWPKAKYRRQMVKRFRKKPKGSRHRRLRPRNVVRDWSCFPLPLRCSVETSYP